MLPCVPSRWVRRFWVYEAYTDVSPAIFACTTSPCIFMHMFSMFAWLLGLTWWCLPAPTGEFRVFDTFQHVLMVSFVSAVVFMPFRMNGMSLCLLDASDRPPRATAIRYLYIASRIRPCTCTITIAHSNHFNAIEASTWPLDMSARLPWLSTSPPWTSKKHVWCLVAIWVSLLNRHIYDIYTTYPLLIFSLTHTGCHP